MMKKEGYPYFHPHRVRYSEIDLQGIVYNSRYLDYFDAAITEYMRHCGFNYVTDARNTGKDFHLVKASVEFLKPVPYDEEIEIGVRVGRIGRKQPLLGTGLISERVGRGEYNRRNHMGLYQHRKSQVRAYPGGKKKTTDRTSNSMTKSLFLAKVLQFLK